MDTGIQNYIPSFKSNDKAWMLFHKKLDKIFSRKETNSYWLKAWKNTGGDANSLANTAELRDYMETKGIVLVAPNVWQAMEDSFSDFGKGFKNALIVIVVVIAVIIAAKIYFGRGKVVQQTPKV